MYLIKVILVLIFPLVVSANSPMIKIMEDNNLFNKSIVKLGDIAKFEGLSPQQIERFKGISIVKSKKSEVDMVLSAREMSKILRSYLVQAERQSKIKFELTIPPKIKIRLKKLIYSTESVTQHLNTEFKKLCKDCLFEFNLRVPNIDAKSVSRWELEVLQIPKGNFSIPLTIHYNDRPSSTEWVTGRLKVFRYYPVTTRFVQSGDRFSKKDVKLELREGSYLNMRLAKVSEIIGQMALKTFRAGEIVGAKQVAAPFVVSFGDSVKIESGNSSLRVTIDGVAQQRARVGEVIRVKIPRTKKIVKAQVVSEKRVELR